MDGLRMRFVRMTLGDEVMGTSRRLDAGVGVLATDFGVLFGFGDSDFGVGESGDRFQGSLLAMARMVRCVKRSRKVEQRVKCRTRHHSVVALHIAYDNLACQKIRTIN